MHKVIDDSVTTKTEKIETSVCFVHLQTELTLDEGFVLTAKNKTKQKDVF